ncbi:MAG: phospho-N-acetylmuramoyl-pentapeptide-transferase [Candidatus Tectomicrobia bacterium]|nr:phospho-N-acetylmuramoyl-pentapeptide-transferase [Candidatus Tectomicrobia bacterium]
MLYELLVPLKAYIGAFNVFRYITFRTSYAIITGLLLSFLLGPVLIRLLKRYQIGESIRGDGPQNHLSKAGTPTMGGLLIIVAIAVPTLLWANLRNPYIWIGLLSLFGYGAIGFWDDYLKLRRKKGLSAKPKLLAQLLLALLITLLLAWMGRGWSEATVLSLPFFKTIMPTLGWLYLPVALLVIVGTSNAVNLTDGLDGLAIGPLIIAFATYMVLAYLAGHARFAAYLDLIHVRNAGELAVFCGAIVGGGLGFLWFNSYPAQLFMGNVGSLALGGTLGSVAVLTKHEVLLVLVGGLFVMEAGSVILQVASYKTRRKRIFKMAPLHHHFEVAGWQEPKVIVRFWIVSIILALLSLSTLKLR